MESDSALAGKTADAFGLNKAFQNEQVVPIRLQLAF
jgi:hypothetical protein